MGQLMPHQGRVDLKVPFALLDQHVGLLDPHQAMRDDFLRLNPSAEPHSEVLHAASFPPSSDSRRGQVGGWHSTGTALIP